VIKKAGRRREKMCIGAILLNSSVKDEKSEQLSGAKK
jgi:hypothetical protein